MPLVSVIVPSYNHEKYIVETIESIVNQTYKNIELIVIDDGSKDNSLNILKNLQQKYNFTLISRENKGLSATLNEGVLIAKGKYVSVCASDDILVLEKIEKQVSYMEINLQYMISYGKVIYFYPNGATKKIRNSAYKEGDVFESLLLQKFFISPASVIYRKEVFDKIGGFDTSLAVEDADIFLRIAKEYQIGYQNEYFYYYRLHENNTVNDIEKIELDIDKILNKWKDEPLYKKAMIRKNLIYFRWYAPTKKMKALSRLPLTFNVFFQKVFYNGLLKLIIPTNIYNIYMRLKYSYAPKKNKL